MNVRFHEDLHGRVAFGEEDVNRAWATGERCAFHLDMTIDADPGVVRPGGQVRCAALGGRLPVVGGEVRVLERTGERRRRFLYWLWVTDREGRELTFSGVKQVVDDENHDVWFDTSSLFVRVGAGHVPVDEAFEPVATGMVRLRRRDFAALGMSFRGRLRDLLRFGRLFTGGLADVYGGPASAPTGTPSFPLHDRFEGGEPGVWGVAREGLERRILAVEGGPTGLTLHHLRRPGEGGAGEPVLLLHPAATRAQLFYGAPGGATVADLLLDAGFDVWAGNWRGSIDLPPVDWTVAEVAAEDLPALVARVRAETGARRLGAVGAGAGGAALAVAAAEGVIPEVDRVVLVGAPRGRRRRVREAVLGLRLGGLDAQWGRRAPSELALAAALIGRLRVRDCRDPVCRMGRWAHGELWTHAHLDHDTHAWLAREVGYAPFGAEAWQMPERVQTDARFTTIEPEAQAPVDLLIGRDAPETVHPRLVTALHR